MIVWVAASLIVLDLRLYKNNIVIFLARCFTLADTLLFIIFLVHFWAFNLPISLGMLKASNFISKYNTTNA